MGFISGVYGTGGSSEGSTPTPLSSLLDSDSASTAATSRAVKALNDKIIKHNTDNTSKISDVNTQLVDNASKNITDDFINVMNPPTPLLPLQLGWRSDLYQSNSTRLQSILDNLSSLKRRKIFFPLGVYGFAKGLIVPISRVEFVGVYNDIDVRHGTQLVYHGSGDFITLGTPLEQSQYGDNLYNGIEHFTLRSLLIDHGNANTVLNNVSGTRGNRYAKGSRALVDWCGGCIVLDHTTIQHFECGVYLIQSDFNEWFHPKFLYNKCGVYIASRSDQNIWIRPDFTQNETALWVDGAVNLTLYSPNFVTNGAGSGYGDVPPVKITSGKITMYSPWIESFNLRDGETLSCFLRAGCDVGWRNDGVLQNCKIQINDVLSSVGHRNLIELNKAEVEINGIQSVTRDLDAIILKKGTEIGSVFYSLGNTNYDLAKIVKLDTGAANLYNNGTLAVYNQMRFKGTRFHFDHPTNALQSIYMESSADSQLTIKAGARNTFNGIKKMTLERGGSSPVSGDFEQGDYCKNTSPQEIGSVGSKYIVLGWVCITSGSPGVWKECRVLTGS